jgi:ABC-type amino acid transport substrate-binding protein
MNQLPVRERERNHPTFGRKKMRKKLSLLLAVAMSLSVVLTGGSAASAAEDTSKLNLMKPKSLVVCMTLLYVPQMHLNSRGKPTGYDYELLRQLSKDMGLKLEIRNTDFNGLLAGIASKQCDMTSVGLRKTAVREQSMTFAGEYMPYSTILATQRGNKRADTNAAWNTAGTKITCVRGTVECAAIKDNFPNATAVEFPDQNGATLEAASGRADGALMTTPIFAGYSKNNPNVLRQVKLDKPLGSYFGQWSVQLGNTAFASYLQQWICEGLESGMIQKTFRRTMGTAMPSVPSCPA